MTKILTLVFSSMFIGQICFCQIIGKKSTDTYMLFDSIPVHPGDTLHLGSGSDRRGDFEYIYQPPNFLIGIAEQSLPRQYANKYFIIKHFKIQKDKRTGDKTVAVITPGGINWVADLEGAIKADELLAINSLSVQKKEEPKVVVVQNQQSMADELTKLKKLYDDGTLTKEEYEAAKKKLLEKQ